MNTNPNETTLAGKVREILLDLAKWARRHRSLRGRRHPVLGPSPSSVIGHRAADTVLRAEADRLAMTA